jgi:mRNA-degrading endonuclease toxin of MazEF toxin-antitoxin module
MRRHPGAQRGARTRHPDGARIPTEVALSADDGMPESCVLTFDNLYTVPKGHLTSRITRHGPAKLAELCAALDVVTDC